MTMLATVISAAATSITTPENPGLIPATNEDGTRTAVIAAPLRSVGAGLLLTLALPAGLGQSGISGRYFLARCGATTPEERQSQWQIYLRRPLYAGAQRPQAETKGIDLWEVLLPESVDEGYRWLAAQPVGTPINLLGPFGQGFSLTAQSRNLLILSELATAPLFLALGNAMLDRGGRVTLVLRGEEVAATKLVDSFAIPVEVRIAPTAERWQVQLQETLRWADQVCVALPRPLLVGLADAIRTQRFRLEPGFAQALIQTDLLCGVGACLACVVPTRDGRYSRACVHGPVFDLTQLV